MFREEGSDLGDKFLAKSSLLLAVVLTVVLTMGFPFPLEASEPVTSKQSHKTEQVRKSLEVFEVVGDEQGSLVVLEVTPDGKRLIRAQEKTTVVTGKNGAWLVTESAVTDNLGVGSALVLATGFSNWKTRNRGATTFGVWVSGPVSRLKGHEFHIEVETDLLLANWNTRTETQQFALGGNLIWFPTPHQFQPYAGLGSLSWFEQSSHRLASGWNTGGQGIIGARLKMGRVILGARMVYLLPFFQGANHGTHPVAGRGLFRFWGNLGILI